MESALVVSSGEKGRDMVSELLARCAFQSITAASSGSEARRLLLETDFDLVVINSPLSDEFGGELAQQAAMDTTSGVIMLVRTELAEEVAAKVEDYGVFVVPKPVSRQFFYQSLKLVRASRARMLGLRAENVKLQQKIEEIRLVDRAKCALIQYLKMDEAQAHRYIEKQAMDLRITRRRVAQAIINTYES